MLFRSSTKYSWSGSFDRLAKGRTTMDSRGAGVLATAGGICGLAAAGAWTDTVGEFPLGQAHQATIAKPIAARRLAAITARCGIMLRRAGAGCAYAATRGVDATAAAPIP